MAFVIPIMHMISMASAPGNNGLTTLNYFFLQSKKGLTAPCVDFEMLVSNVSSHLSGWDHASHAFKKIKRNHVSEKNSLHSWVGKRLMQN